MYRSDGIVGNAPLKVGDDFMCETKGMLVVKGLVCSDHVDLV
jgi:hypothetical protein